MVGIVPAAIQDEMIAPNIARIRQACIDLWIAAIIPCSKYAHFHPFDQAMKPANKAEIIIAICGFSPASFTMDQYRVATMTSMTRMHCQNGIFLPIIKTS